MNAFCYTEPMLAEVIRLRERRRNAMANAETGLYDLLSEQERKVHGDAYQRFLDAIGSASEVAKAMRGEPFAQPADTSKTTPSSPDLPIVGPKTQAPWANKPADKPASIVPPLAPTPAPFAWAPQAAPIPARIVKRKVK